MTDQQQDTTKQHLPVCPLSDLPRLLCGCPEHVTWAADLDDLVPAEVAYLKGTLAADDQPAPRHHQITPTPIPGYGKARPWSTAINVSLPTSGRLCQGCADRPAGDAFLCPECVDDLRVHLADVPGLLDDLAVLGQRQAVVNTRPGEKTPAVSTRWDDVLRPDPHNKANPTVGLQLTAAGYHRPLHVERAVNARRRLNLQVTIATRTLYGKHAVVTDTRLASRHLLGDLAALANRPAASDIAHGLQHAHDRAMAAIDNVEAGVYLGLCDNEKCRAPMHADPDHAEHQCLTCHKTYDVAQRREAQRHRIRESLLSLREIADYSLEDKVAFGRRLHLTQLKRWVAQNRLIRAGAKPGGPKGEVALYRAADVLALVDEAKAS